MPLRPRPIIISIALCGLMFLRWGFGFSNCGRVGRKCVPESMHASTNMSSEISPFPADRFRSATHLSRLIHLISPLSKSQDVINRSQSKRSSSEEPATA